MSELQRNTFSFKFIDFLASLVTSGNESLCKKYYESPEVVSFLFSELPALTRVVLLRIILSGGEVLYDFLLAQVNLSNADDTLKNIISFCVDLNILSVSIRENELAVCTMNSVFYECVKKALIDSSHEIRQAFNDLDLVNGIEARYRLKLSEKLSDARLFVSLKNLDSDVLSQLKLESAEDTLSSSVRAWSNLVTWVFYNSVLNSSFSSVLPLPEFHEISDNLRRILIDAGIIQRSRLSPWFLLNLRRQLLTVLSSHITLFSPEYRLMYYRILCTLALTSIGEPLYLLSDDAIVNEILLILQEVGLIHMSDGLVYGTPLCIFLRSVNSIYEAQNTFFLNNFYSSLRNQASVDLSINQFVLDVFQYHRSLQLNNRDSSIISLFNVSDPINSLAVCEVWTQSVSSLQGYEKMMILNSPYNRSNATHDIASESLGIICESNFRVFYFNPDIIKTCILEMFARITLITPVMVIGVLDRHCAMNIFDDSISSDDIIDYLVANTNHQVTEHVFQQGTFDTAYNFQLESMLSSFNTRLIPENITNQLRLWEKERNNMKIEKAVLIEFDQRVEIELFPELVNRLKNNESLLCYTNIPASVLSGSSSDFSDYITQILNRIPDVDYNMLFSHNKFYSNFPIIVIKEGIKNNVFKMIKEMRAVRGIANKIG